MGHQEDDPRVNFCRALIKWGISLAPRDLKKLVIRAGGLALAARPRPTGWRTKPLWSPHKRGWGSEECF